MKRTASAAMLMFCFSVGSATADCAQLGDDIRPRVCPLATGFNPNADPYQPPTCQGNSSDNDKNAVQGAFMLAPPKVKEELCRLKQIFVLGGNTTSWGLWENPVRGQTPGGRQPESYVALAADVLATPASPDAVLNREDAFVHSVLRGAGGSVRHSSTTTLTGDQSRHFAILSVLLHEIGHIKWHRDNIYSSLACYYQAFVPRWDEARLPEFRRRTWAPSFALDDARGGQPKGVKQPPGDFTLPEIRDIYDAGFTTAVGAVSPEEDFVEAYKITAYRKGPVPLQLSIRIPPDKSVTQNPNAASRFECLERSLF